MSLTRLHGLEPFGLGSYLQYDFFFFPKNYDFVIENSNLLQVILHNYNHHFQKLDKIRHQTIYVVFCSTLGCGHLEFLAPDHSTIS